MIDAANSGTEAFAPSGVAGYSRDWNGADATKLYTDTAHTALVTANDDPVGAVLCSAGSGVYLIAPSDAARLTYKTNIQNGLSVMRADGTDDCLSNLTGITADASQTIFAIVRKNNANSATARTVLTIGATSVIFTSTGTSTAFNYYADNGAGVQILTGTPTDWNILALKFTSDASLSVYVNGGAPTTFDPFAFSALTGMRLSTNFSDMEPADFDYGRVLVYSGALSNSNLDYLFSGLGAAWGITVSAVS
jgi:hypothetical protein